jgi:ammonia channel protein AmtB
MYTRVFRTRLIWTIILTVLVQVFVFSLIAHYVWEYQSPSSIMTSGSR